MPVRGKFLKTTLRYDLRPVVLPIQNGELVDSAEHVRHEIARDVHRVDHEIAIFDADVHVCAEDQQALREVAEVLLHAHVPLERRDCLFEPRREGMGAGGGDHEAVFGGESHHETAQADELVARFLRRAAHLRADFHHRLVKLRLHLADRDVVALQHLGDVRPELARLRIDDLILLLDAERQRRCLHGRRLLNDEDRNRGPAARGDIQQRRRRQARQAAVDW